MERVFRRRIGVGVDFVGDAVCEGVVLDMVVLE